MLAYIKGILEEINEDTIVVDCQGMGYMIYISQMDLNRLPAIGQPVKLHIHMSIREDDISLFGFLSKDALQLFRMLISVSGIGPKAGIALLSVLTVSDLQMAILSGDVKTLTKANGVGTKGAQRVIVELKDKLSIEELLGTSDMEAASTEKVIASDVISLVAMALIELGYSQSEATMAVRQVPQGEEMTEDALLKAALRRLV